MTNPNNALGTNGAFNGRTSANALNDIAALFSRRGIVSGWRCVPSTGLTVALGGNAINRDVAIAEDNVGNKTTVNNISQAAVEVTLDAAPSVNSRVDSIVAYVNNPPQGSATEIDNPGAVGIVVVSGTVSASPAPPTEGQIRSAITADGATGSNAYFVVLASITLLSGVTDLTENQISQGRLATVAANNIGDGTIDDSKINSESFIGETDANGWNVQYLPSGKRLWTKMGTFNITLGGNAWGNHEITSPPAAIVSGGGVTGTLSGACAASDNAVAGNIYYAGAAGAISYRAQNAYGSSVTSPCRYSLIMVEN